MNPVTEHQQTALAEAFAAQLRAERALRNLDQEDVAKASSFSLRTYLRIENGAGANLHQMAEIAAVFDIDLPELLARTQAEMKRRQADPVEAPKRTAYPQRPRTAGNAKASKKANVSTRQSP